MWPEHAPLKTFKKQHFSSYFYIIGKKKPRWVHFIVILVLQRWSYLDQHFLHGQFHQTNKRLLQQKPSDNGHRLQHVWQTMKGKVAQRKIGSLCVQTNYHFIWWHAKQLIKEKMMVTTWTGQWHRPDSLNLCRITVNDEFTWALCSRKKAETQEK